MKQIRIVSAEQLPAGKIEVVYGTLASAPEIPAGATAWEVAVTDEYVGSFSRSTLVRVRREACSFTFFLRDVNSANPIWVPRAQTAVLPAEDMRSYDEVVAAIRAKGRRSDFARMEAEPEESYENACRFDRDQEVPVWLGLGRDMRFFRVSKLTDGAWGYWGEIQPHLHNKLATIDLGDGRRDAMRVKFCFGPGAHCRPKNTRRLEEGVLPILHVVQDEESVQYRHTYFATLENAPLGPGRVRGSDPLAAWSQMFGANLTEAEKAALTPERMESESYGREETLVCCVRVEAVNVSAAPAYAFWRAPRFWGVDDFAEGISSIGGLPYAVSLLNGEPLKEAEGAILLQPGKSAVFDIRVTFGQVSLERARKLFELDYEAHLAGCRAYWKSFLAKAAQISIPEAAVDERLHAGLLHLELVTEGLADAGPLLPSVGVYGPIGTESCPIIQFYESMGLHEDARRCIEFFFSRQEPNGYINAYTNYGSETGPVLWTAALHYRYTGDREWLAKVAPKLKLGAEYLLAERAKNKTAEARAVGGYGLVNNKVSDCEDYFFNFFLNGGVYLGMKAVAEVFLEAGIETEFAAALAADVREFKQDLHNSVAHAVANAPVTPLQDGTWNSAISPWPEYNGVVSYFADGGKWYSHGTIFSRMIAGPSSLALTDVLAPHETLMDVLLDTHQHPLGRENAALSQPYYQRNDYAHVKRGDVKLFLKLFYNQFAALQDRQSYTFWEHYFECSSHKTHEEGWFLMQVRWMLAFEEEDGSLSLLKVAPRAWLKDGKSLKINGLNTIFGRLSLIVEATDGQIRASVRLEGSPRTIRLRLPHPCNLHPRHVNGGSYDPATETVSFVGNAAEITLEF